MNKYTINELTSILGISRTAVNRKIEKYKFDTVQEYVNGVSNKLVILTDEQLEALKQEALKNKGVNTVSQHSYETKLNNDTSENIENTENQTKLFETMLTQLQHYADTAITAEREKTRLLEDKSSQDAQSAEFYKNKVFELTQEYNRDKTELTQQLNKDKIELANKAKKPFIIALIIVSIMCVTLLTGFIYVLSHPKTITQEKQITKVITVENGKIKSVLTEKGN